MYLILINKEVAMELILDSKSKGYSVKVEFNVENKCFVVLKGSTVSADVAHSEKFRGEKSIETAREQYVKDSIVQDDVTFKSPSTAANFITGRSTNGMIAWKDKDGKKLKELL